MKKLATLLIVSIVFISCKNDSKTEETIIETEAIDMDSPNRTKKQSDGLTLLKGEFVYYSDAAVLQTHREVYGVVMDDKMMELNKMAEAYKKEPTDYTTVSIRGKVVPKPENEEGWPFRVEIKEILSVSASNPETNNVVKLESK
ncbi:MULTISPECIES: hypothetical protein [Bizionia]|uniref:NlpE C-terminal OB domain-containing protein n=1 Tax=Bizionia algoritergicola TaxID=291187 RepID=A0A5D0R066_9FLAO|nr:MULTISPECIES: hypothetical protein [Bizionia]OBX23582.1 hypothetical protein BAA08_04320 [Bizionia sp. APA-3]TYB74887.1 hypothetical protein ES675_01745 [Bizionia algoritergicola]